MSRLRASRFGEASRDLVSSDVPASTAAIIVNYRAYDDLDRCLAALERFEPALDLIVVDHDSQDTAAREIRERHPRVQIVASAENRGFGAGVNRGVRETAAVHLLLINPDGVIQAPIVTALQSILNEHPDVAVVGPLVRDDDGSIQASARRFPGLSTVLGGRSTWLTRALPGNRLTSRNLLTGPHVREPLAVDWVSGACMLVRREAFEAIGGFDEGFFLYWEDADLCRRLHDAGWRTMYHPGVEVHHVAGRSSRHAPMASERAFHDSVFHYFLRHTRAPARWSAPLIWIALRLRLAMKLARHRNT
jgi:GT2 family glycosyltransferase